MPFTPTITFRGMRHSRALESDLLTRVHKLGTYYPSIVGCHVLVDLEPRRHEHGNRVLVRINVAVPGEDVVIGHDAQHARVAIREAFAIARRRLQDFARRQRGDTKMPARQTRGRVSRLSGDHGYVGAPDGHDVYFHRNSVLKNAFERLTVGSDVAFLEELGDDGPQASTVRLVHPRRVRLQGVR